MRHWQRQGLGFKIAVGIGLTLVLILGGAFYFVSQYIQAQLWQREVQAAREMTALVPASLENAMLANRWDQVQEMLAKLGQTEGTEIDDIAIYGTQNKLAAFASGFSGGRTIRRENMEVDVRDSACAGCHQLPVGERPGTTMVSLEGQEVMRSCLPLYNQPRCQNCHGTEKSVLGTTLVDFRVDRYRQTYLLIMLGLFGGGTLAIVLAVLMLYLLLHRVILFPLGELVAVTRAVAQGGIDRRVQVRSNDEVGQLGIAFNSMTERIRELIGSLEQRVAERTADLERRSRYLQASTEVGHAASTILETGRLIEQVVELIRERFDLYYVGLFLINEEGEWAVLRAGTGEAGQKMLARGHRLQVGGSSMVGWTVANGQARIALEAGKDAVRLATPELPNTRSEAALPLRSRGQVLGALTVQSDQPGAFDQAAIAVLQIMADQVAVALDNARLFAESQAALEATRRAYGELSHKAWTEMARSRRDWGYRYVRHSVAPAQGDWQPEMIQAAQAGQTVMLEGADETALAIPLKVHDQVIGVLGLRKDTPDHPWTLEEKALLEILADQLAAALESARLYQDTQRRAERERLISEIATKMRGAPDVDGILQTTVQEIRRALGATHGVVRLRTQEPVPLSSQEAATR